MQSFCISGRYHCMSARHFHRLVEKCLHLGRHTCMSARHFHRSATLFTILLYLTMFKFISIEFKAGCFCISSRHPACRPDISPPCISQIFLHLGPPNPHVGSRFCMSAKRIPSPQLPETYKRSEECSARTCTTPCSYQPCKSPTFGGVLQGLPGARRFFGMFCFFLICFWLCVVSGNLEAPPIICGHLAASRRRLASRTTISGQIMGARGF